MQYLPDKDWGSECGFSVVINDLIIDQFHCRQTLIASRLDDRITSAHVTLTLLKKGNLAV